MKAKNDLHSFLKLYPLGKSLLKYPTIWQTKLLKADELDDFGYKRGLKRTDITQLWQFGWIRADQINSRTKISIQGIMLRGQDQYGNYLYSDERKIPQEEMEWKSATKDLKPLDSNIMLLFHPFRYYVLYHIDKMLGLHSSPMQMFLQEYYHKLLEDQLFIFNNFSQSQDFINRINVINNLASLSIAIEPCIYVKIFGKVSVTNKHGIDDNGEQNLKDIESYWKQAIKKLCKAVGKNQLEEIRQELCIDTQTLDPNRWIHTLICLGDGKLRMELEGRLGGALVLRTMAETLRRATEKTFNVMLREEDELGFGMVYPNVKKELYGSNRILDKNENVVKEFMKQDAFHYGLCAKFYVEGDTEFQALYYAFQAYNINYIELINLRGEVAQKRGKGVAFRDNLKSDIQMNVFSFILIDGDRFDFVSAVKKAAHDDEICGSFFISHPDFEFANFDLSELEEIIWNWILEDAPQRTITDRNVLHDKIKDVKNGEELLSKVKATPQFNDVTKGSDWGKRLIQYALQHPRRQNKYRPIIEAIHMALRTKGANYQSTRNNYRVDENSGQLVKRIKNDETPSKRR